MKGSKQIRMPVIGALIIALIVAAVLSVNSGRTRFVADIASLFPSVAEGSLQAIALERTKRQLSGRILFLIGHEDENAARAANKQLKSKLASLQGLTVSDVDDRDIGQLTSLHAPAIGALASPEDLQALQSENGEALIQRSLSALYMPGSAVHSAFIRQDPLGLYPAFLAHMSDSLGKSTLRGPEGRYYSRLTAFMTGTLAEKTSEQTVLRDIKNVVTGLKETIAGLEVHSIGAPYYAEQIAQTSKYEASRITAIALAGIIGLLFFVFRSVQPIFGALFIISIGVTCGAVATVLIFSTVHLIAVAFGSSLVGIVVDYAIHFYSARRGTEKAVKSAQRIRSGLVLGTGTSLLGFFALAFSNVDILQQVAVYSAFGVAGAAACVLFLVPHLKFLCPERDFPNPSGKWRHFHRSILHPSCFPVLCVFTLALGVALLMEVPAPKDHVRSLRVSTPKLAEIETMIAKINGTTATKLLLVEGVSSEDILQREEVLQDLFAKKNTQNLADHVWGISTLIPSIKRQKRVLRLEQELLNTPAAAPLRALMPQQNITHRQISLEDISWAMLPAEIRALRVKNAETGDQGHLMVVRGVTAVNRLEDLIDTLDGVSIVDATASYTTGLMRMREKATYALLGGVFILSLLFIYGLGLIKGVRVMIVPTFASLSALIISALLGPGITFFSVMAGFLVFALGADYALFQMAAKPDDKDRAYLAVSLSALSTFLVFGLLALSAIPVLQIMGSVVVIGVVVAWMLAPLATLFPEGEPS